MYANEIKLSLDKGTEIDDINMTNIDLRLSTITPIHAKWLIKVIESLRDERDLIQGAFQKAGMWMWNENQNQTHICQKIFMWK